jgi:hypothetical protein
LLLLLGKKLQMKKERHQLENFDRINEMKERAKRPKFVVAGVMDSILEIGSQEL